MPKQRLGPPVAPEAGGMHAVERIDAKGTASWSGIRQKKQIQKLVFEFFEFDLNADRIVFLSLHFYNLIPVFIYFWERKNFEK